MKRRVRLERPSGRRMDDFLAAVRRSRRLHGAWVSPPATVAAYRQYLRRLRRANQAGYLVCHVESGELVGVVNVSEIVRGNFRSAYLGYYALTPHAGRGLMAEGLALAVCTASKPTSSRTTPRRCGSSTGCAFVGKESRDATS